MAFSVSLAIFILLKLHSFHASVKCNYFSLSKYRPFLSSPCPPLVFCRDLCQSAVGHRDILWHRAPLCLLICFLETLLAPMAGQGRRRAELDIRVAAWKCWGREPRRRRRVLTLTSPAAEEGGPLLILALPLPRAAGPASPPFL